MQEVLSVFLHHYSSDEGQWHRYGEINTAFLRCSCNTAQIRVEDYETSGDTFWLEHIPPHPKRALPDWVDSLPKHIADLLQEVHLAWRHEQRWLVAMGARSLIDMFAVTRVGDIGGFAKKLVQLQKEGDLAAKDKLVIEAALEVGHKATHRAQAPNDMACGQVLDIVENLLHRLVLAEHAADLSAQQGKRTRNSP